MKNDAVVNWVKIDPQGHVMCYVNASVIYQTFIDIIIKIT